MPWDHFTTYLSAAQSAGLGNSSWVESRIQKTGDRRQNKNIAIRILSSVDFFGTQSIGAELPLWTIKKFRITEQSRPVGILSSVFCILTSVSLKSFKEHTRLKELFAAIIQAISNEENLWFLLRVLDGANARVQDFGY